MSDSPASSPDPPKPEGGVGEALRAAVERTMRATAGSAASTRERAADLVDDVVRRGREARDELARRGQEAGEMLARRGQEATAEIAKRVELLERRLAELERELAARDTDADPNSPDRGTQGGVEGTESQPEAEG